MAWKKLLVRCESRIHLKSNFKNPFLTSMRQHHSSIQQPLPAFKGVNPSADGRIFSILQNINFENSGCKSETKTEKD